MAFTISTDWLTAIGTVASAVVALSIASSRSVKEWFERPKIRVEFENREPFCRHVSRAGRKSLEFNEFKYWLDAENPQADASGNRLVYAVRLRIRNVGHTAAQDCEARLLALADSSGKERTNFDPIHMHWVGMRFSDRTKTLTIHRGAYEYLDVLFTDNLRPDHIFVYSTEDWDRGINLALERGDYIFKIGIYGANFKATPVRLSLSDTRRSHDDIALKMI